MVQITTFWSMFFIFYFDGRCVFFFHYNTYRFYRLSIRKTISYFYVQAYFSRFRRRVLISVLYHNNTITSKRVIIIYRHNNIYNYRHKHFTRMILITNLKPWIDCYCLLARTRPIQYIMLVYNFRYTCNG